MGLGRLMECAVAVTTALVIGSSERHVYIKETGIILGLLQNYC